MSFIRVALVMVSLHSNETLTKTLRKVIIVTHSPHIMKTKPCSILITNGHDTECVLVAGFILDPEQDLVDDLMRRSHLGCAKFQSEARKRKDTYFPPAQVCSL